MTTPGPLLLLVSSLGPSLGQRLLRAVLGARSSSSPGGWMLRMTRVQEQDRGLYSCLASNEAGEVRRNFSVEVLGMSRPHSPAYPTNSSSLTSELLGARPQDLGLML